MITDNRDINTIRTAMQAALAEVQFRDWDYQCAMDYQDTCSKYVSVLRFFIETTELYLMKYPIDVPSSIYIGYLYSLENDWSPTDATELGELLEGRGHRVGNYEKYRQEVDRLRNRRNES